MEIREVRVEFKKTVSDGNYGNETYSVVFTSTLDEPTDEAQEIAFHLAEAGPRRGHGPPQAFHQRGRPLGPGDERGARGPLGPRAGRRGQSRGPAALPA